VNKKQRKVVSAEQLLRRQRIQKMLEQEDFGFARDIRLKDHEQTARSFLREVVGVIPISVGDETILNDFVAGQEHQRRIITLCLEKFAVNLEPQDFQTPLWQVMQLLETRRSKLGHELN
jgi:hypothetical protein